MSEHQDGNILLARSVVKRAGFIHSHSAPRNGVEIFINTVNFSFLYDKFSFLCGQNDGNLLSSQIMRATV